MCIHVSLLQPFQHIQYLDLYCNCNAHILENVHDLFSLAVLLICNVDYKYVEYIVQITRSYYLSDDAYDCLIHPELFIIRNVINSFK